MDERLQHKWHRVMTVVANSQGIANMLDLTYTPPDTDMKDLFTEQQNYFYAVLTETVQTDRG